MKYKPELNVVNKEGQTPLHVACLQGFSNIVSLLIQHGAIVTNCDKQGNTPLHLLVNHPPSSDNVAVFYKILEQMQKGGSGINERNLHGETPLHCAAQAGSEKFAMWLIRQGAEATVSNKYVCTQKATHTNKVTG
mgnify:CR=1 FL=1